MTIVSNNRSLTVGESWGGSTKPLPASARPVACRLVQSGQIDELSLYSSLPDAFHILIHVPAQSSLVSLRVSPLQGGEQDCIGEIRQDIATSIAQLGSLRNLVVPSAILHRSTFDMLALLPSLQALQLTSQPVTCGEW